MPFEIGQRVRWIGGTVLGAGGDNGREAYQEYGLLPGALGTVRTLGEQFGVEFDHLSGVGMI